jgi:hypothetical protein
MSFIVAGCVLFLALLSGVVLDDISVSTPQKARRDVSSLGAWWAQQGASMGGALDRSRDGRIYSTR